LAAPPAAAFDYVVRDGDDLYAVLSGLVAGDTVTVEAGTYERQGFFEVEWLGTQDQPIVVQNAPGARPVMSGDESQNQINLSGSWFTFRGFEIVGGSHGIRLATCDHATIEDMLIHDTADVGISANREDNEYAFVTLRHNEVHHTGGRGECFYLGCNTSACRMHDSLIEGN
jgi:hypothetical protein